ncbi:calcium-binding protein [Geminocystis sp. GBBB08]|uniref:calcium-binding protein n=1 Tax=Geminocystis sp. GBBB08 TaxID=2604140 RepID=UPI0027E24FBD|nr:calcium-binding protein [Geminocystis sp. GBBB08]MBL1209472.1 calcium-binding protein [Geminocystis sp. GBBB08]
MKILITIPHFFRQENNPKYGSQRNPEPRIQALTSSIVSLQQLFGKPQLMIKVGERIAISANTLSNTTIDIFICTTGNNHLIDQIPLPSDLFKHYKTNAEALLLGFECHKILQEKIDQYDYYCYLEDDLIIRDAQFFTKLNWFNQVTDYQKLLQANRYELSLNQYTGKCYIDGDLLHRVTASFQNVNEETELQGQIMNNPVIFRRALNPHSGCFFLNNEQMKYWAEKDYFLDQDISFVGPLESIASLGIMKTFKLYKPAPESANFLEVHHWGSAFVSLLGSVVKLNN